MKFINILLIAGIIISFSGCNEEEKLVEVPLDFLSPENALNTPEGLQAANYSLYYKLRNFYKGDQTDMYYGTDMWFHARSAVSAGFSDYTTQLTPNTSSAQNVWSYFYGMIYSANVVIGRSENVVFKTEVQKNQILGEARFFRGFAYKMLANLYGGVPLVLEETLTPKRDFERATREATYTQSAADLEFASQNLPSVEEVTDKFAGKLTKAAAFHALSEVYISLGQWNKAISAASSVIDNPKYSLMTKRFGNKATKEGDPYWDLYQVGNQNRTSGNTEGILVLQTEPNFPGGGAIGYGDAPNLQYERQFGPLYWYVLDTDGKTATFGPTTQQGGRPGAFVSPTKYFRYTIWNSDWKTDIRNNERNLKRDFVVDNPSSKYLGQKFSSLVNKKDTIRDFYPYTMKATTLGSHPDIVIKNKETGELQSFGGGTFRDWYLMRLAETYLLRAEAYLGSGDKQKAANDINALRSRAGASLITAGNVSIDIILDERARELDIEEMRRFTLCRLGLLYKRVKQQNLNPFAASTIQEYHNLYPIPYSEIEKNTGAVLVQNPGYKN